MAEPSCSGALWRGGQSPCSPSPLVKVLGLGEWLTEPGEAPPWISSVYPSIKKLVAQSIPRTLILLQEPCGHLQNS